MVKSSHSWGKPCIGVGPGNAPVLIDEYDLKEAIHSIVIGKTFDTCCLVRKKKNLPCFCR